MPTAITRSFLATGTRLGLYREAASNAAKQADWCGWDASGNIVALLSNNTEHITSTTPKIAGIMGRDGKNQAAADTVPTCPVYLLTVNSTVELSIYSATPTNAEWQDLIEGQTYALRNQGGIYCAMMDTTANGSLVCLEKYTNYGLTDQYVKALFKIVPASLKELS